jgi:glycosyltransferase involved in cell wall biosynthesis
VGRRFLFLEPFYGGSHREFADGWAERSRHRLELATLPASFWKWRMRGAALHFAGRIAGPAGAGHAPGGYHGLVATSLMSLSDLKALWGTSCPRALVYFHENQLSYPLPPGETLDVQFGFTDITTALAADRVLFNSRFQMESFFERLPGFLERMPDHRPRWVGEAIRARAGVLHPGCRFPAGPPRLPPRGPGPPLIVWNHRWEFDKRPEAFFAALDAVLARGREFRLALLGENFQVVPQAFLAARERYGGRIARYGFVERREEYLEWLGRGAIVVSTAAQENFGMAVVEAVRHGCRPLLPDRLAYPEVLDRRFHAGCLYRDDEDLVLRLDALLADPAALDRDRADLAASMERYAWERAVAAFDAELDRLADPAGVSPSDRPAGTTVAGPTR